MRVLHYLDAKGHDLYQNWLDGLRDTIGRVALQRRIAMSDPGTGSKRTQDRDIAQAVKYWQDYQK